MVGVKNVLEKVNSKTNSNDRKYEDKSKRRNASNNETINDMKRSRIDYERIIEENNNLTKEYENDNNNDYKHENKQHIQMITISNDNEKNMVEKQVTDS